MVRGTFGSKGLEFCPQFLGRFIFTGAAAGFDAFDFDAESIVIMHSVPDEGFIDKNDRLAQGGNIADPVVKRDIFREGEAALQ